MSKYSKMTNEDFIGILTSILGEKNGTDLLSIPGIYEIVAEYFNNNILDIWAGEVSPDSYDYCKYAHERGRGMKITEQIFNTLNNMLEECADMAADTGGGDVIVCPICGETDNTQLEILNGEVIGCECGYDAIPNTCICPRCGENRMDYIMPPIDDDFFRCLSCGMRYEV